MISRLRGRLLAKGGDHLVVDVNGLGLRVRVPPTLLDGVTSLGGEINLFTHLRLTGNGREIEAALFGFASPDDLALFELLLTVSGVGPKVALGVISAVPVDTLRSAVAQGNASALTGYPGIGKKTAERIVMELKGKVGRFEGGEVIAVSAADTEALGALTALGYSVMEAQRALAAAPGGGEGVEERVLNALRYLGGR